MTNRKEQEAAAIEIEMAHQRRERAAKDLAQFEATRNMKDLSVAEREEHELLKSAHSRALANLDEVTMKARQSLNQTSSS